MTFKKVTLVAIVIPFSDPAATLETVGGKGYSLARLHAAGLPVPPGFFVTTAAYQRFVADNNLAGGIQTALSKADIGRPATLDVCSRAIQNVFLSAEVPAGIVQAIDQAYSRLNGKEPAVAVRSSATAEDLPDLSFAGQQDTYLNVRGTTAVVQAVRRCWASLWNARAIGYRIRNKIGQERISLAAVVQELVPAESAGVLFTANPLNGRRDQSVINAVWGLGESIVGGLVTPDSITLEKGKKRARIVETRIADKHTMIVPIANGTGETAVPEKKRRTPVLSKRQAEELVRLGERVERLYGTPMDIEWARAGGTFLLLQARPITTLPNREGPPVVWELPDPKGQYMRTSIVELLPGPLSPLFATMGIRYFIEGNKVMAKDLFGSASVIPENYLLPIGGFAYMKISYTPAEWWAMLRYMVPNMPGLLRKGVPYWRNVGMPAYQEAIARWEEKSLPDLSAGELLAGARDISYGYAVHLGALMASTIGPSAGSEGLFTQAYVKLAKREGDPPASTFLMGFENAPLRAEKNLYDLAMWCKPREALTAYLSATPAAEIVAAFTAGKNPASIPLSDWEDWRRKLKDHLRRFGYSIYNMDFSEPLPRDDPGPIVENLRRFVTGAVPSPYEREKSLRKARERATASIRSRLGWLKRWIFDKALHWAQSQAPLREDGIAEIGLGYPLLRSMLIELGSRLARGGMLSAPGEVFWLEETELESAAAALDRGEPLPDRKETVGRRIAVWNARRSIIPPPALPPTSKVLGFNVEIFLASDISKHEEKTLKGFGASAGVATAPARVLRGPEDFESMQPGEVLVAAITTPAWTPLFTLAAAVVTDIGGPLSHSSIVAREYGIPAVLGTGVATQRIRSGQTVTVDGGKGIVILGGND
jgi:phosphohistidine swiveling domain-containing protein